MVGAGVPTPLRGGGGVVIYNWSLFQSKMKCGTRNGIKYICLDYKQDIEKSVSVLASEHRLVN